MRDFENEFPSSYWANTSSNSIVRRLIDIANEDTKGEIEAIIEGKILVKPVHEEITYDEVYETMDKLWNFMFFTGYFRKVWEWMDEQMKTDVCGTDYSERGSEVYFPQKSSFMV